MASANRPPGKLPALYRPELEHDSSGGGFVADISGRPSFRILDMARRCVTNLPHRGAVDADAKTGDGAGVLFQIPVSFFRAELERLGQRLGRGDDLAGGMGFLPGRDERAAAHCREALERGAGDQGLHVFGWREVPVDPTVLGDLGASTQPRVEQILLGKNGSLSHDEFGRALYLMRKDVERWARE